MNFLKAFYSLDIFQINSPVPMIYYEPLFIYIYNLIISTPNYITISKCEKLNKHYIQCGFC